MPECGSGPVEVLVIDDHLVFSDAISLAIDSEPGLRCIGTERSGAGALEAVSSSCPSVVLLDLNLPDVDGLDLVPELLARCPQGRVIVLTANTSAAAVLRAVEAGVHAFLPKEHPFEAVLEAIRDENAEVLDRLSVGPLLNAASEMAGIEQVAPELTTREREVLELLAQGEPVKSIAQLLGISVHTCRGYVRSLLDKFDVHTQLQAVVRAAALGMLPNLHSR